MPSSIVTVGESMVLGVPSQPGRLRHARDLELKIGGAESNLAIALSRLGLSAGWVSMLGDDEPGQLVMDRIRAEGVDTSQVRRLKDRPTGLYLREKVGSSARVYYYRRGSAASEMAPKAFDPAFLQGAHLLHLTGITPALSAECREFTLWIAREARERSVRVSFDLNYRSKLCSKTLAREFAEEILPETELFFLGDEEARAIWGQDDRELLQELAGKDPGIGREVIIKRGARGSAALIDGELWEQPPFEVQEADPVGAGDAFAAGYLAGDLWELETQERLRLANAMGAYSAMTLGDYEGLPDRKELYSFLGGKEELGR